MRVLNSRYPGRATGGHRRLADPLRSALGTTAIFAVMAMIGWAMPAGAVSPAVEVNTCGQSLLGDGFLSGDLDCSAFVGTAVTIDGGTFDLRGFTLTSGSTGVLCTKSCKVVSDPPGGTITSNGLGTITAVLVGTNSGSSPDGVNLWLSDVLINDGTVDAVTFRGRVTVIDSTITGIVDNSVSAVSGSRVKLLRSIITANAGDGMSGKAKVIDSDVSNNGGVGVDAFDGLKMKGSTISGNGSDGVHLRCCSGSARVIDSVITGNGGSGVTGGSVFGRNTKVIRSDISGNAALGISVHSSRLAVRDSTIDNNGAEGIRPGKLANVKNSTVTGNSLDGIAQLFPSGNIPQFKAKLSIPGSTVTGNGTDADCGVVRTCADVTSTVRPRVSSSTTCDTSYDANSGFPGTSWGVCSLD